MKSPRKRLLEIRRYLRVLLILALNGLGTIAGAAQNDKAAGPPVPLSLKKAVEIALAPEGNARLQLAEEAVRQAQAQSAKARAALLPALEGSVGAQSRTTNLAAAGVQLQLPVPGFFFHEFVGPFSVYDARATIHQSLLDLRDRKSTRLNSSHSRASRMPSSA